MREGIPIIPALFLDALPTIGSNPSLGELKAAIIIKGRECQYWLSAGAYTCLKKNEVKVVVMDRLGSPMDMIEYQPRGETLEIPEIVYTPSDEQSPIAEGIHYDNGPQGHEEYFDIWDAGKFFDSLEHNESARDIFYQEACVNCPISMN